MKSKVFKLAALIALLTGSCLIWIFMLHYSHPLYLLAFAQPMMYDYTTGWAACCTNKKH